MRVIKIGRSSNNDIVINDNMVSRVHCQIIEDENRNYYILDLNSTNGVYVNGMRRNGQTRLNHNDIVRIGNTTLPWTQYFGATVSGGNYGGGYGSNGGGYDSNNGGGYSGYGGNNGGYVSNNNNNNKETSTLGIIALLLAIVGAGLAIWFAVDFFTFIGEYNDTKELYGKALTNVGMDVLEALGIEVLNKTIGIIAFCVNIGAVILASVSNFTEEEKDTSISTIANSIAGFAACAVGAMLIYFWTL